MSENRPPLINVHVEKTAGRSLRKLFIESYGADSVMTYDPVTDTFVKASDRFLATEKHPQEVLERLIRNRFAFPVARMGVLALKTIETRKSFKPEELPEHSYVVATGHFSANRLEDTVPPETARYVSVVRDPLDRMLSHYDHWMRSGGLARFRVQPTHNPNLTFEQFALLPELQNYQAQAIGESINKYHLLGTVDKFEEYLEELGLIGPGQEAPHVNRSKERNNYGLSSMFLFAFEEFHQQDYELYHTVNDRWA